MASAVATTGVDGRGRAILGVLMAAGVLSNQVISELSAIGAPTTALWARLLQGYAVLFAAFTAAVVWQSRGLGRLRLTAWLLVAFVLSGPVWGLVPMHQRGDAFTWTDAGHIALGGVMVALITIVIAVSAGALGPRFRAFSRSLAVVAGVTGVGTFAYVPRMIEQRPTPGVGLVERVHLYAFLLWVGVLAVALFRRHGGPDTGAHH
jgi:hypothetical protein